MKKQTKSSTGEDVSAGHASFLQGVTVTVGHWQKMLEIKRTEVDVFCGLKIVRCFQARSVLLAASLLRLLFPEGLCVTAYRLVQ